MKRRFLTVALALILCLSLSVNAFASTVSKSEWTNGETVQIYVTAELDVNSYRANAKTSATSFSGYTVFTSVTYYYTLNGGSRTSYGSGETFAGAGVMGSGTGNKAESWHSVSGSAAYGSWHCSLSATP